MRERSEQAGSKISLFAPMCNLSRGERERERESLISARKWNFTRSRVVTEWCKKNKAKTRSHVYTYLLLHINGKKYVRYTARIPFCLAGYTSNKMRSELRSLYIREHFHVVTHRDCEKLRVHKASEELSPLYMDCDEFSVISFHDKNGTKQRCIVARCTYLF